MFSPGGRTFSRRGAEPPPPRHKGVHEVACIGVDDKDFGQRPKPFVVPAGSKKPSEDELKSYVKSNLARFKVPREFEFADEPPRNATGKDPKRELEEREREQSAA